MDDTNPGTTGMSAIGVRVGGTLRKADAEGCAPLVADLDTFKRGNKVGQLDAMQRALTAKNQPQGTALRLMADIDGLPEIKQQLNDIVTQMNCLPVTLMDKLEAIEKNQQKVDLTPGLQKSIDSLRSLIGKLVKAVEGIKIELPEQKEKEWVASVERKKGRIDKVRFKSE